MGGAIFSHSGTVVIQNSTFTQNVVTRGSAGAIGLHCTDYPEDCVYFADNGQDEGGAIFAVNGELIVQDSTIAGNISTGEGAGIVVDQEPGNTTSFALDNTIISNPSARECFYAPGVNANGAGNLIVNNFGCPGMVATGDPQVGPLQNNGGLTPTLAIPLSSPAANAGDADSSLAEDQRGTYRPQGTGFDIGAFELCIFRNAFVPPCFSPEIISGPPVTVPITILASPSTGGTTNPAPGTFGATPDQVLFVQAIPTPGNTFLGWSGPVTDPGNASTTVISDAAKTITANFTNFTTTMAGNITAKTGRQTRESGLCLLRTTGRRGRSQPRSACLLWCRWPGRRALRLFPRRFRWWWGLWARGRLDRPTSPLISLDAPLRRGSRQLLPLRLRMER